MIEVLIWVAAIGATLVAIDRLALWAEERGWIYWRRKKAVTTSLGAILSDLNTVTNPSAQHVVEAKQAKKLEERDNGDPPEARG